MYETRQNKEKVSRRIDGGKLQEMQLRGGKLTTHNPKINCLVNQLKEIEVDNNDGMWRSTQDFDGKHLTRPIPKTVQEWVDWRTRRWPGFITGKKMYCTLITGNLNQAIENRQYNDPKIEDDRFEVTVQCTCTTVNPYNTGNPIAANNICIENLKSVIIGGYYNNDGSNVIDHLVKGV